jgi:hypothetical protein
MPHRASSGPSQIRIEMGMARWQSGIVDGSISTGRAHNQPLARSDRRRERSLKV